MSKSSSKYNSRSETEVSTKPKVSRRNFLKYAGVATAATAFSLAGCDNNPVGGSGTVTISSISPEKASPGSAVTIKGSNFSSMASDNTVLFGNIKADILSASPSKLVVKVPMGVTTGKISLTITVNGQTVMATIKFTVISGPKAIHLGSGDVGVLNLAYALEQLEYSFYTRVQNNPFSGMDNIDKMVFKALYNHEKIHTMWFHDLLGQVAKSKRIGTIVPDFSSVDFSDRQSVLKASHALEETGIGAYNGAGQFLQNNSAYLLEAGKIVSVEARHTAIINSLLKPNDLTYFAEKREMDTGFGVDSNGLDQAFTVKQTLKHAGPFIRNKVDASGLMS